MTVRIVTLTVAGLSLAACGSATVAPVSTGRSGLPYTFNRPVQHVVSPDCMAWFGPPSLDYLQSSAHYRAVAIVTIDRTADTRWNTPDGLRPTQAQAVAEEASPHRYTPFLMSGLAMHPTRVFRGVVPASIVAYSVGGTLGADSMTETGTGCLVAAPKPEGTRIAAFGSEIDRQATTSLVRPVIAEVLPYDPSTKLVVTRDGPMLLPSNGL